MTLATRIVVNFAQRQSSNGNNGLEEDVEEPCGGTDNVLYPDWSGGYMVVFMKTNAVGLRPCTALIPYVSEIKGLTKDFYFIE